jgi:hypothetical protein
MVANSDFKGCQTTLEELCEGLTTDGKYSHMRMFLHRNFHCKIGSKFLMVTSSVFGVVVLRDLTYENGFVIVQIYDCVTQQVGNVRIDINDERPNALFICFEDIKSIVLTDNKKVVDDSGLLEFEY